MKSYTEHLHEDLLSELAELDNGYNPENLIDRRLGIIIAAIDQVKEKLRTHIFESATEEVEFFKWVLPPLLSLYLYYADKIEWDRLSWQASAEIQYAFIDKIYSQVECFRKENQTFWAYYRDQKKEFDHFFFLRNSPVNHEIKYQIRRIVDPTTPPLHSEILATLMAYTRLEQELKTTIAENKSEKNVLRTGIHRLKWTGKQIELIELGYALWVAGTINYGKAEVRDIFRLFGDAFEIDPGNTTRLFQDILRRKAGYTPFLDSMKRKLLQRIDEIESESSDRR